MSLDYVPCMCYDRVTMERAALPDLGAYHVIDYYLLAAAHALATLRLAQPWHAQPLSDIEFDYQREREGNAS